MTGGLAAALAFAMLQQPVAPVSDERVAYLGGGDFLIARRIDDHVVSDPTAENEWRRIGVRAWCEHLRAARSAAVALHGPDFRARLISVMRRVVPDEVLGSRMALGWNAGPITTYHVRIRTALDREAGSILFDAGSLALTKFTTAVRSSPTVAGEVAVEPFGDWRLEKPDARRTACLLLGDQSATRDELSRRKAVFDGFYKR